MRPMVFVEANRRQLSVSGPQLFQAFGKRRGHAEIRFESELQHRIETVLVKQRALAKVACSNEFLDRRKIGVRHLRIRCGPKWLVWNRQNIDIAHREARGLQTKIDRRQWQAALVLPAAETLLFDGSHELSVADDRGGRVMTASPKSEAQDVHSAEDRLSNSDRPLHSLLRC